MPEKTFYAQVKKYCEIYVTTVYKLILSVYAITLLSNELAGQTFFTGFHTGIPQLQVVTKMSVPVFLIHKTDEIILNYSVQGVP